MASLFDKINLTSILIALSILTVFAIFQVIDHVEYNLAFGSFHETSIIPITSESEFLTYDDLITGFGMKYRLRFLLPEKAIQIRIRQGLVLWLKI